MTQFLQLSKHNRIAINYPQVIECLYISLKFKHSEATFIREIIKLFPSLTNVRGIDGGDNKFLLQNKHFPVNLAVCQKCPKTLKWFSSGKIIN